ncbi:MAG: hypothetical protein HQL43_10145 [Alphaproteobacteria bacterium]|nr:hypothetical protein [Alphaproteobacteria bacterium]
MQKALKGAFFIPKHSLFALCLDSFSTLCIDGALFGGSLMHARLLGACQSRIAITLAKIWNGP